MECVRSPASSGLRAMPPPAAGTWYLGVTAAPRSWNEQEKHCFSRPSAPVLYRPLLWSQVVALKSALTPQSHDFKSLDAKVRTLMVHSRLGPHLLVGMVSTPYLPPTSALFTRPVLLLH